MKTKYKIIVVGSGPGGCVPALLFAEKGLDVLMIEEGSQFKITSADQFTPNEMNKKYRNGGQTMAFGSPLINYAEGMCVGGGSEVNSGLYHRIPEEVLSKWEHKNNINFDRSLLDESYSYVEKKINVSYCPADKVPLASKILEKGSKKLGWKCSQIPRWYSYNKDNDGIKQSMTETLVPDFIKAGGNLLTDSKVVKVSKNSKNQNIITVVNKEKKSFELISDFVFISAGAIQSPFLLLKSGIKKNIGTNLKLHPSFKFTALFDEIVNYDGMGVPVHQVKEFSPKISIGCSISSKSFLGVSLNDNNNIDEINKWKNMATYYSMISPKGHGSVKKLPFFNSPFVTFSLTKDDKASLYESIDILGKLLFECGARKIYPSFNSKISFSSYKELCKFTLPPIRKMSLMTIHLFSSIQMGGEKNMFPLSPEGNLWCDKTIYISDGSMLCDSPSVNPQGTIMAIARMNALNFLDSL